MKPERQHEWWEYLFGIAKKPDSDGPCVDFPISELRDLFTMVISPAEQTVVTVRNAALKEAAEYVADLKEDVIKSLEQDDLEVLKNVKGIFDSIIKGINGLSERPEGSSSDPDVK